MNAFLAQLHRDSLVYGCYGLGFVAAPLLTPALGPIGAFLTAMAVSTLLAVAASRTVRRDATTALHRRLAVLADRERLLTA